MREGEPGHDADEQAFADAPSGEPGELSDEDLDAVSGGTVTWDPRGEYGSGGGVAPPPPL